MGRNRTRLNSALRSSEIHSFRVADEKKDLSAECPPSSSIAAITTSVSIRRIANGSAFRGIR